MRRPTDATVAGGAGAATTGGLAAAAASSVPPTGTVAAGAVVTALLHWRHDGRRRYRRAGTVFVLATAALLAALPTVPAVYRWSLIPSLAAFGLLSALVLAVFVFIKVGVRAVASRFVPEEYADALADFASTLSSALIIAWTVIQAQERLARTAGTGFLGSAALAANWYGYKLPIDVGMIEHTVEVTVVVFVGAVVVGFHTLASWDSAWRVAGQAARHSREAVRSTAGSGAEETPAEGQ